MFLLFCSKRRITEFYKHFSFVIKNILTKGSLSGTNPKTADTSNSCGEGTEQAEAIDMIDEEEMGAWERINLVTRSRGGTRDKPVTPLTDLLQADHQGRKGTSKTK